MCRRSAGKSDRELVLLTLPTVVWYFLFCYLPMFGIFLAFKQYRLAPGKGFLYSVFVNSRWIGLDNFRFLFLSPEMGNIVRNTLVYNITFLILDTVLPVALAVGLSYIASERVGSWAKGVMLLPRFLSWVVVSYFVYILLATDKGIFNRILFSLGQDRMNWYQTGGPWPILLTTLHLWKSLGYFMMIYEAYLAGMDVSYYESAVLDGAGRLQMIRYLTLPQLMPAIITLFLLNLGGVFVTDFGLFYQVTRNSGAILAHTQTIDVFIYKALTENNNFGLSAAASLLQNLLGCGVMLFTNRLLKRSGRGMFA